MSRDHARGVLVRSHRLVEHREPGARADVVREVAQLRGELRLGVAVALEAAERVGRVVVQLRRARPRLLQLVDGLLEQRQRLGVLALVVQQPRVDVGRQRQRGSAPCARAASSRGASASCRASAMRASISCADARGRRRRVGGDIRGARRLLARLVELSLLEQRGRRADVAVRSRTASARCSACTRRPRDRSDRGASRRRRAGSRRRPSPDRRARICCSSAIACGHCAFAGEVDRRAVALEDLALVLRIGQRLAGALASSVGLRADVAERLQPLARVGARSSAGAWIVAPAVRRDRARRAAPAAACGRRRRRCCAARAGSRCRSYSSSRGALM